MDAFFRMYICVCMAVVAGTVNAAATAATMSPSPMAQSKV